MSGGQTFLIVLAVIVGLGIGLGIFFAVKRANYVKALRARGWVFESNPSAAVANGLLVPPFGIGFQRETDEHIVGRTRSGIEFQVFEYQAVGDARVVCMSTGLPLPEAVATAPGQARMGAALPQHCTLPGGGMLLSANPVFADALMSVAGGALSGFGATYPLNFAVDGDQITQLGAPKKPEELEAYLEALAPVAQALQAASPQLEQFRQAPPVKRLGFYHRPSWYYLPTDDGLLNVVAHTGGGRGHRTADVVHGEAYPGCWFVAFEHHWQTTRTESYTDSNGNTQTRTVTDNHVEVIHELSLPFGLPDLAITNDSRLRRMFSGRGASLDFELAAFNDAYDVYSNVPKFAYDVLHPRQIEYLMSVPQMTFSIRQSKIRFDGPRHSQDGIGFEIDVIVGFLARIPTFVWQDLGLAQPPLRLSPQGVVEVLRG